MLYKIVLLIMLIMICNPFVYYVQANNITQDILGGVAVATGLPNIHDPNYKPVAELDADGSAYNVISKILGFFTAIGGIVIVVSIALIGFSAILGSANDKAVAKEKYIGILVAAAILTGGSAIANMVISVAQGL